MSQEAADSIQDLRSELADNMRVQNEALQNIAHDLKEIAKEVGYTSTYLRNISEHLEGKKSG